MVKISKHSFGKTFNGIEVYNYSIKGDIEVIVSSYGATIVSLYAPNNKGEMKDVVLGYDNLNDYENNYKYLGATIGRCCNRINQGKFKLNDVIYKLAVNDGDNHLHGGIKGFNSKVWNAEEIQDGVKFSYFSKDGEEGYPGNIKVSVSYIVKDKALQIIYEGESDSDTLCNLTNHSYFNFGSDILENKLKINADCFTENNEYSIPTGEVLPVENSPMDFRSFKRIGEDIDSEYYQIKYARGFDNNWVVRDYDGTVRDVAEVIDAISGIKLIVCSDYPGAQFYSGNYLDGSSFGKNQVPIKNRSAFCLECQYFPDAINHNNFVQPILKKGEKYCKNIIYKFENI